MPICFADEAMPLTFSSSCKPRTLMRDRKHSLSFQTPCEAAVISDDGCDEVQLTNLSLVALTSTKAQTAVKAIRPALLWP